MYSNMICTMTKLATHKQKFKPKFNSSSKNDKGLVRFWNENVDVRILENGQQIPRDISLLELLGEPINEFL